MRSPSRWIIALALAAFAADDVCGQRGRRRRERTPEAKAPEKPEEKAPAEAEEKKIESWLAIRGADIHLGTGQVLRRATVLVADDKIHEVGHDLEIPEGAQEIDATGMVVAPGFVAAVASGLGAPRSLSEGKVVDSLNPYDPAIKMGLSAGVTSYLASFGQGSDKPGGGSAVLKLAYGDLDGMVVAEDSTISMRVPLDAKQWADLRLKVEKATEAIAKEAADDGEKKDDKGSKPSKDLEPYIAILKGEKRLWVSCQEDYSNPNILQALELARLFGHGVVLDNPVTAWAMADEIANTGSMALIDPRRRQAADPGRPDSTGSNIASCAVLNEAGVPVAVRPPGGRFGGQPSPGTGGILGQDLHTLHLDAAFAVRGGMDNRKALRTITLDAAKLIGADARIGSIEAGKDADLLILDGDPLHYRTFVTTAIVNGKVVYQKDKEPFYSHIKR